MGAPQAAGGLSDGAMAQIKSQKTVVLEGIWFDGLPCADQDGQNTLAGIVSTSSVLTAPNPLPCSPWRKWLVCSPGGLYQINKL